MAVTGPWSHGDATPLNRREHRRLAEIESALRADGVFLAVMDGANSIQAPPSPLRRPAAATIMLIGIALAVTGAAMAPRSFVVSFIIVLGGFLTVAAGAVRWSVAAQQCRRPRRQA
jgi:uncharacterized membrane protein YidH (DUF202 family)